MTPLLINKKKDQTEFTMEEMFDSPYASHAPDVSDVSDEITVNFPTPIPDAEQKFEQKIYDIFASEFHVAGCAQDSNHTVRPILLVHSIDPADLNTLLIAFINMTYDEYIRTSKVDYLCKQYYHTIHPEHSEEPFTVFRFLSQEICEYLFKIINLVFSANPEMDFVVKIKCRELLIGAFMLAFKACTRANDTANISSMYFAHYFGIDCKKLNKYETKVFNAAYCGKSTIEESAKPFTESPRSPLEKKKMKKGI